MKFRPRRGLVIVSSLSLSREGEDGGIPSGEETLCHFGISPSPTSLVFGLPMDFAIVLISTATPLASQTE